MQRAEAARMKEDVGGAEGVLNCECAVVNHFWVLIFFNSGKKTELFLKYFPAAGLPTLYAQGTTPAC